MTDFELDLMKMRSSYLQQDKMEQQAPYGVSFVASAEKSNPLDEQVGGNHYKDMAIQPVEFCMKNNLNFCVSSVIKYLCRYKSKNGLEDLKKARHFVDLLIKLEYPDD